MKALDEARPEIIKAAQAAIIDVNASVIRSAKINHRYKRRSGDLQKATKQFEESSNTFGVHIDETIASYGEVIHDGRKDGSWAADPFLTKAFNRAIDKKKYSKKIVERVNRVLAKVF